MAKVIGLVTANYYVQNPSDLVAYRPVASMPFLGRYRLVDFALSNMVNAGIRTVGLIMPPNYRSLIDHVGSGKDWGLDRKAGGLFVMPGSNFGTSRLGGRFLVRDLVENKQFLERNTEEYVVLSTCNFIYNIDLKAFVQKHIESGADITVLTKKATEDNPNILAFTSDAVSVTGKKLGVEFGDTAFMDLAVMKRELLLDMLGWYKSMDHKDLFCALIESGDISRVTVKTADFNGYAAAIFDKQAYYQANMDLLNPKVLDELSPEDRFIKTKAHDNAPAKYEPGSHVTNSLVSAGDRIYGAVVDSVLSREVIVEPGATVRNSIVMQGTVIKTGARVENAILDRGNIVAEGTALMGTPDDVLVLAKHNE